MAHRKTRLIGVVTAAMAGSMLVPAAVQADVGAARVVLVTPLEGVVIVEGLDNNELTTVEVRRDGVLVSSVTAAPAGFGVPNALEVNHLANTTLCWENSTPEILPGDQIRVIGSGSNTANTFTDTVDIIDLKITQEITQIDADSATVKGFVGTPRPDIALLDVFLRADAGGDFRRNAAEDPNTIEYDDPLDENNGAWTATFNELSQAQIDAAQNPKVLEAEFARAANEIIAAPPGDEQAPAAEGCPPLARHAVTSFTPPVLNIDSAPAGITIEGVTADASEVRVSLNGGLEQAVTPSPATGPQTFEVFYSDEDLSALQGSIAVTSEHDTLTGAIAGKPTSFVRDTIRPGAPGISTPAGVLNNSAQVTLTPPEGGASMFYTTDGSTPSPSSTKYTVPFTLTDSATVRAIAVDTAGNPGADPAGIAEQQVTIVKAPAGPGSLAASAANGQATLSWLPPGNTNNGPITGYTVRAITGGQPAMTQNVGPGARSHTFTGLTNGLPYTLSVLATNSAGSSDFVQAAPVTPQGAAGQPTGVRGEPGVNSALVSWTPPANNGGTPVTGYKVNTYQGGVLFKQDSVGANQTAATIGGLLNGVDYTFRVVATNAAGDSAESAASQVVTPQQRPARVRRVRGIDGRPGGRTTATARWLAPRANTAELVRYEVRAYKVRRNGRLRLAGEAFSRVNRRVKTMTLRKGTYVFQVRAIGEAGNGRWSKRSGRVTAQ